MERCGRRMSSGIPGSSTPSWCEAGREMNRWRSRLFIFFFTFGGLSHDLMSYCFKDILSCLSYLVNIIPLRSVT